MPAGSLDRFGYIDWQAAQRLVVRFADGGCMALYDVMACMAVWLYALYALYSVTGEP